MKVRETDSKIVDPVHDTDSNVLNPVHDSNFKVFDEIHQSVRVYLRQCMVHNILILRLYTQYRIYHSTYMMDGIIRKLESTD